MKLETILRDVIAIQDAAAPGSEALHLARELRQQLETAVKAQTLRSTAGASLAAVIKHLHKLADAEPAMRGEVLKKCWPSATKKGHIVIPGCFYAFRLAQDPGIERAHPSEAINMDQVIDAASCNRGAQLRAPSVADVKAWRAIKKAEGVKHPLYRLGDAWVDSAYLIDVLTVLPGCELYQQAELPHLRPLYFTSDTGDAVLLPVRPPVNA